MKGKEKLNERNEEIRMDKEEHARRIAAIELLNVDEDIRQAFVIQGLIGYPGALPTLMQISRNLGRILKEIKDANKNAGYSSRS